MIPTGVLARVSRDDPDDDRKLSIQTQIEACVKLADDLLHGVLLARHLLPPSRSMSSPKANPLPGPISGGQVSLGPNREPETQVLLDQESEPCHWASAEGA
jgi:hypothetical protein